MVLTSESRSTRRMMCLSATLSTAILTNRTDLGLNPDLRGEWTTTNILSQVTASGGKP
jgi:hypothetical protein